MEPEQIILTERTMLRGEIQDLKKCQVQYFSLSVAGTAAIIGWAGRMGSSTPGGPIQTTSILTLAPLLILIPCWWVFFDKATTITRAVGLMRILEEMLSSTEHGYQYRGLEGALARFRKAEAESLERRTGRLLAIPLPTLLRMLSLRTRYRYWVVNWYSFAGLSASCWLYTFGLPSYNHGLIAVLSAVIIAVSTLYTLRVVANLTAGKYSYEANYTFWKQVLSRE